MFHLYNKHRKAPTAGIITRLLVAFALFVATGNLAKAQLSGSYYVGGSGTPSYATLQAAISDLNTSGVSGPVTIYVAAGYTETAPSATGYLLGSSTLNASLSSTNTLTIVKSGSGANPTFTAATGGTATAGTTASALNGILALQGADYVTIDGLSFQENASNTTTATWMEYGIAFLKLSATDGCQNNTIKNCAITLNKGNNASGAGVAGDGATGIWLGNTLASNNVALTGVTTAGANSNNTFTGNLIQNCNTGIMLYGFADASPYANYDQNNNIGGIPVSGATSGNTIVNFGGGGTTSPAVGIRSYYGNNLMIANNTINNNNGSGANHASTLRGMFFQTAVNANITVRFNTMTIKGGGTTSSTAWIESTAGATGTNNLINISNNTFTGSTNTAATSGVWNGIYTQATAYNTIISSNTFTSNASSCTSGSYYFIYNTGAIVNSLSIDSNTISGQTFGAATTSHATYYYYSSAAGTAATTNVRGNSITNITYTGTGSGAVYGYYFTGTSLNYNFLRNNINNVNMKNSGTWYLTYQPVTYPANATITWTDNLFYNITRGTGTGTTYGHYFSGSSPGSVTYNVYNNQFHDCNMNGGSFYHFYNLDYSSAPYPSKTYHDNLIYNETNLLATYGFYLPGLGTGTTRSSIYNNTFRDIAASSSTVYGIYASNTTAQAGYDIYNNKIYNITLTTGTAYCIYPGSGYGTVNCYKNLVSNVGATTTGTVYGLYFPGATGVGSTFNFYNNIIGHIYSIASTSATGLLGMYIAGGTTVNLYNNTVYLDFTNTSTTTFGSSVVYVSTTTPAVTMRNNIFYSRVNPGSTGGTAAGLRYTAAPSTAAYTTASNNNCFYVSGASTTRPIYVEGTATTSPYTNAKTTLSDYKTYMSGRDQSSVSEDVSSLVISTSNTNSNYLHLITTAATQLESGGSSTGLTSLFTTDYDGNPRAGASGYAGTGTAWDMGASEFNGIPADFTAPSINHTALGTTCNTGDRTFTANITDGTGLSLGNSANYPTVYFKKGFNGSYFSSFATFSSGSATNGNWTFTISAATLGGLNVYDTVYYFLVAQDSAATQNTGTLPGGGVATSVTSVTTPPTAYSYIIGQAITGTYNVGVGQAFSTITAAAAAYNNSCIVGNVVFNLTDALYDRTTGESFPIDFKHNATVDANNYLTIHPAAGVSTRIRSGASNAIRIYGADYMVIDGSNNGTNSRNLNINIDSTVTGSNTTVLLIGNSGLTNGNSTNNVVKNCQINGPATGAAWTGTADYYWGIAIAGTAGGNNGADNDNNTLDNNYYSHLTYAVAIKGTSGISNGGDDNCIVSNSVFDSIYYRAVEIQNSVQPIVRGNDVSVVNNVASTLYALYFATIDNAQVYNNKIHRLYNKYNSSYTIYCIYAPTASGTTRGHWIYNNAIYDVESPYSVYGIYCYASYSKIVNNSYRLEGTNNYYAGTNYFYNIYMASTAGVGIDIVNNIIHNTRYKTGYSVYNYLIYGYLTYNFTNGGAFDYNIYNSGTTNQSTSGVYDAYNGVYYTSIASLKTCNTSLATGQNNDHSSFSDPLFNPLPSFYCDPSSYAKNNGKLYTSSALNITSDINGTTRSSSVHSIGASETFVDVLPPIFSNVALSNQFVTTNPTYSNIGITDASGVQVGTADAPRMYFKRSTELNQFNGNTAFDNGWKWVYANNAANPYSFTVDYSLLLGGSANLYDTIQYFFVAQDSIGNAGPQTGVSLTSRVTSVSGIGSGHFPASGYSSYLIIEPPLHGVYSVGAGGNFSTINAAINAATVRGIDDATAFELISTTYNTSNTTFPIVIPVIPGATRTHTLTIRPASGVSPTIGAIAASSSSIIKLDGADYVIIDGSNNGSTSRDLTITDSTATVGSAVVWMASLGNNAGATHNIIRNTNIGSFIHPGTTTATIIGISLTASTGYTSAGSDNDSNSFENNFIHGVYYGIYTYGNTSGTTSNDSIRIVNNLIGSDFDSLGYTGIYTYYNKYLTIKGNTIKNVHTIASNPSCIYLYSNTRYTEISNNDMGSVGYLGTAGYGGKGIYAYTLIDSSNCNIFNNSIHDFYGDGYLETVYTDHPAGILFYSTGGGGYNVYFNTISLQGTYGYANVSYPASLSMCINVSSTTSATTVPNNYKNNILYNNYDNTGTTQDVSYAFFVSNTNLAQTIGVCDYNDYFVGTNVQGGSNNPPLAKIAGTVIANLAGVQSATSQDVHSLQVDPNLNSNSIVVPNVGSPILGMGTPISGYTTDQFGTSRSATAPSMGAYEVGQKLSPPKISFTKLVNQSNLTNLALSLSASITDPLGVDVTNNPPRLYYKKRSEANQLAASNSSSDNGWKYVVASNTTSPYSFTFDWSILTSYVNVGDTIQYFLVAQDVASPANVSNAYGALKNKQTSTSLTSTAFPYLGQSEFVFVGPPMHGTYTVGVGQNYTHITDAINDMNLRGIDGATQFQLTDALYDYATTGESFPITIGEISGASATNTISIKPAAGVTTTITAQASTLLKLDGADYVTIDGSNNGTSSRNLTFYNSLNSTGIACIWIASKGANQGATNNTLKNTVITHIADNSTQYGICVSGSTLTAAGSDNDYITIENNMITNAGYGMYLYGTSTNTNDHMIVRNNDLGRDTFSYPYGIYAYYLYNSTIEGNNIRNIYYSTTCYAMYLYSDSGLTIRNNSMHDFTSTSTAGYGPNVMYIYGPGAVNHNIYNNLIYNVFGTGWSSITGSSPAGIVLTGTGLANVNLYYNTVYMSGNQTPYSTTATLITASLGLLSGVTGPFDIRNNIFVNTLDFVGNTTDYNICIANQQGGSGVFSNLDYNIYYANGPQNFLAQYGATQSSTLNTLAAIQSNSNFGGNTHSLVTNPNFNSATNLVPQPNSPVVNAGTPISGITTDFNSATRSSTAPYIGAFESAVDLVGPTITYAALANTGYQTSRVLNVTITDATGVPTSGGADMPNLFWKVGRNGTYVQSQASYVSGSTYQFTLGGSVNTYDTVYYYMVAQDVVGNVSVTPSTGASGLTAYPTSGIGPVATTAPTSPPSYIILPAVAGTFYVGQGQTYTSFTQNNAQGLFKYLQSVAVIGDITVVVTSDCSEDNSYQLAPFDNTYNMYIVPDGPTVHTMRWVTNQNGPMMVINGAANVYIDGRYNGTGRYLRFVAHNTTTGTTGACLRVANSAYNVEIRNCIFENNSSANPQLNIFSNGNSNNIRIYGNLFKDTLGSTQPPYQGIYVYANNFNIKIGGPNAGDGNEFVNHSNTSIYLPTNADTSMEIAGNSFYRTIANTTGATAITLTGTASNTKIYNNSIGGSDANRGGAAYTYSSSTLNLMSLTAAGTKPILVYNNTFSNIGATSAVAVNCINISGVTKASIYSNTFGGGATAADTIKNGYDNGLITSSSTDTVDIYNNTISNVAYYGASGDRNCGIYINGGYYRIYNNTIANMAGNASSTSLTSAYGLFGMYITSTTVAPNSKTCNLIYGNTINGNKQINAGTASYINIGINLSSANARVYNNKIYGFTAAGTGTTVSAPQIVGIFTQGTGNDVVYNNMISFSSTRASQFRGIESQTSGSMDVYYNTIYVGGSTSTSTKSYGFFRSVSSPSLTTVTNFKNNLIYMDRSAATAVNFAVANLYNSYWTGYTNISNNIYVADSANKAIAEWVGTAKNLSAWASSSGETSSSAYLRSVYTSSVFNSPSTGNLAQASCYANNVGVNVAAVSSDMNGNTRNASTPDVGANEYTPVNPAAPSLNAASSVGTTQFTTSWSPVTNAIKYTYDLSSSSSFASFVSGYNGRVTTATSVLDTGLSVATTYYYRVKATDGGGCTSAYASASQSTTSNATLNLVAFFEGFYVGSSTMNAVIDNATVQSGTSTVTDTITVEMWDPNNTSATTPYVSAKGLLSTSGAASLSIDGSVIGGSYYIRVVSRNHIATWSANPVSFGATTSYNFSTSDAQAAGYNLRNDGNGVFMIYAGDINQDGSITNDDAVALDNDNANFAFGYLATDLTGDASVTNDDAVLLDNNNTNFVGEQRPF